MHDNDIALIDGDILSYSLPYSVQNGHGEDSTLKEEAERWLEVRIDKFIQDVMDGSQCSDYKVFLTSRREDKREENFRYKYLEDYKGARTGHKPILHDYCREYLISQHLAVLSSKELEADDMIAKEHMQLWQRDNACSVICSIDKDFDQLPGWHYRWEMRVKNKTIPEKKYFVTEFEGLVNLYTQALTGDKIDNIGYHLNEEGKQVKDWYLQGIGPKKAQKILQHCENEEELYNACFDIYLQAVMEHPHDHAEQEAETLLENNLKCLYLVQGFRGKDWKMWVRPRRKS